MKKMIKTLLLVMLSFSSMLAMAVPAAYIEGQHYKINTQRLAVSDNNTAEVVELFMYTCPHCYHLEPEVEDWKKSIDDKVNFVQVPAVFSPKQIPLATAFYAAEALGVSEKLHPLLFEAIHEDGLHLATQTQILNYVASQGIDRASFEKMMTSFAVKTKVKKAAALTKMSGIDGVPAFVVNGQYHTSGPLAGSVEAIFEVVDFLVDQSAH
jgi:thiol:disulfide interchange protein DsbA